MFLQLFKIIQTYYFCCIDNENDESEYFKILHF